MPRSLNRRPSSGGGWVRASPRRRRNKPCFRSYRRQTGPQAIPPRDRTLPCPLSPGQQRLWFLEQLNPGVPVYNEAEAVRLRGELNVDAMEQALNTVVARHEMLRTTIQVTDGQPLAMVHESWPLRIKNIDLSALAADERQAEVERLLVDEPRGPYRLEAEPGIRATLRPARPERARLHPDDAPYHLRLVFGGYFVAGVVGGVPRPCSRRAACLAFLAAPERRLCGLAAEASCRCGFRRRPFFLEGEPARGACALGAADRSTAAGSLFLPGRQETLLARLDLGSRVRDFSRREQTSLFTVFAAAFNALFYRYTGQEDILVGIVMAERDRPELQSVIGFLLHTHVLRTELSGDITFRELAARVQRGVLGLYSHRGAPFDQVVSTVQPQRNPGYSPLFQVMLNWRDSNPLLSFIGMEGLVVESLLAETRTSKFDMILTLTDVGDDIWLEIEYSTDLFDEARVDRMIDHLRILLGGIVAEPDQPIGRLPLLTDAERRQLLVEWNHTARDYPRDRCVHQLFEEQVDRTPEAAAVAWEDRQLTYRELNAKANQLARRLRTLGVGPEVPVGICLRRSPELILGLLGILKAGGAYLPLDPETPPQRLAFMLADGKAGLVLTQTSLRDRLAPTGLPLLCLDEQTSPLAEQSPANLPSSSAAENLAYVMYTSGSTGVPKGVEIPHRAINRLLFGVDYVRFVATLRVAQLAPISFDASTLEIWGPLLHGGCCVLFPDGVPDFAELEQGLRRHRIQTLWLTASLFNAIVDERPQTLRGIEQLLTGGEALSVPHVRRAMRVLGPTTQLINGYGPTESTTFACCYPIPQTLPAESASVPIGRPIANTQAYVLDGQGQLAPVGVPGELYLGGDGLARGYLNRPETTAERFVTNPFEAGKRLYRTGDRVRWRADGTLEFLGRLDDQVKLRGFRIELGEIEAVLRQCPGITQNVVLLREDRPGDKRLVGYYVPVNGSSLSHADLTRHLREKLPEYMVPSAFVALERLPRTPNGKVDRRALPAPAQDRPGLGSGYAAPCTALEEQLAAIWAEVLGQERVGIHDNFFFDLGGHSLLAVRLVSRIQQRTGKLVPLAVLFRDPTVSGMARHLHRPPVAALDLLEPVRTSGSRAPIVWFGSGWPLARLTTLVPPEHPLYWCKPEHLDSGKRLRHTSVEDLAGHYCRQLRRAELEGPLVLCGYSFGGLVAYETARQLQELGREIVLVFLLEPTPIAGSTPADSPLDETVGQRVARHVDRFRSARNGEKLPHLYQEAKALLRLVQRRCVRAYGDARLGLRLAYCEARLGLGLPVPVSLRWTYARKTYHQAIRNYAPQPIPGRLVLVQGEEYLEGRNSLWSGLAAGEFHRHIVPSSGHLDLVETPSCVESWIPLLLSYLGRR